MNKQATFPLRRNSSSLVEKEMAGELMIFDPSTRKSTCLNHSAALVWHNSDGQTSVSELAAIVASKTGTPEDTRVIEFALRKLDEAGLMEKVDLPANEDAGLARRQLFTKLGWAAALLIGMPLVLTVKANARPAVSV
jgi:hypothetical protein